MIDDKKESAKAGMVSVRLGEGEHELVRQVASQKGSSVSKFIRDAVLSQCRPSTPVDYRWYPASQTLSTSGLVLESYGDQLVPRALSNKPYVGHA